LKEGSEEMGVSRKKAEQNRKRILDSAEQLFRQKGVEGVGLAELMKKAGFTQGGFYNHFASKNALVSAALSQAMTKGWKQLNETFDEAREQGDSPVEHEVDWYLSPAHRNDVKGGCPMAGFAAEIPHLSKADQRAYAGGLDQTFARIAEILIEQDPSLSRLEARRRAVAAFSLMVGSLLLSRAVAVVDPALSNEILADGRSSMKATSV
jgi:TetR/AcrR family transcriptional repressor of nem operon